MSVPLAQKRILRVLILILTTAAFIISAEDAVATGGACDSDDSTDDVIPISQLTPNRFHKICPRQRESHTFGEPLCGDGSTFNFFATRPIQKHDNQRKLLIEFVGGGACWDAETCGMQASYLAFPEKFNDFVGLSCSEIAYGVQDQGGFPISMLCARSLGDTDLTQYNTIAVPYCTQDVHVGNNVITYDDGTTVYHKGAHNMMSVLRWVFRNFQNPSNIILTGCSAGGTALPVAYDVLNKHYNRFGARTTQISVVSDSAVYLTPSYFLNNEFANWNPSSMMQKIGFNFKKWKSSEEYPTQLWNYVLRRGSNKDKWGFVSHTTDETSLFYYKWMSGNGEDADFDYRRQLEDQNGNDQSSSQWYSELTGSLSTVQKKHKNVATYWMESDGHCSFGLYYPLAEDEGFESWAADIVKEQRLVQVGSAFPWFLTSLFLGAGLVAGAQYTANNKRRRINIDNVEFLDEGTKKMMFEPLLSCCESFSTWYAPFSITFALGIAISIYFWVMIISQGVAHPLNNPSFGPSAIELSSFGINNPSLIVYKTQLFRLFTSNFLCSGILTYLITIICLSTLAKPLEILVGNHAQYGLLLLLLAVGSNLLFALFGSGASCSSVGLALGLNVIYFILKRRIRKKTSWGALFATLFFFGLTIAVFTFNSWVLLFSSIVVAIVIATLVVDVDYVEFAMQNDGIQTKVGDSKQARLNKNRAFILAGICCIMFLVLLFRIRRPNRLYMQPFYTGCSLMYTKGEDIASIVSNYGDERRLEGDGFDYENMCAEVCIPNVGANVAQYGAGEYFGVPVVRGTCEEIGYDEHMADKTFEYFSYALDVEVFMTSSEEEENGEK